MNVLGKGRGNERFYRLFCGGDRIPGGVSLHRRRYSREKTDRQRGMPGFGAGAVPRHSRGVTE